MSRYIEKVAVYMAFSLLFIAGIKTWGWAAGYPERPITIVVPFAAGGSTDLSARSTIPFLEEIFRKSVIVDNRPGGNSLIGGGLVANAKPDGYTLGAFSVVASIPETFAYFDKPPYTSKELTPISLMVDGCAILFVKSDSSWKSFQEFVQHARKNPGVKMGVHGGPSGVPELLMMAIKKAENVKLTMVPFKGNLETAMAVLGGHVPIGVSSLTTVLPQLKAGNLRVLLFATKERSKVLPDIPCASDLGYDLPTFPFIGYFGPKNLPGQIVERLDSAMKKISKDPRFESATKELGSEVIYEGPEGFKKMLKESQRKIEVFFKELGYWKE